MNLGFFSSIVCQNQFFVDEFSHATHIKTESNFCHIYGDWGLCLGKSQKVTNISMSWGRTQENCGEWDSHLSLWWWCFPEAECESKMKLLMGWSGLKGGPRGLLLAEEFPIPLEFVSGWWRWWGGIVRIRTGSRVVEISPWFAIDRLIGASVVTGAVSVVDERNISGTTVEIQSIVEMFSEIK